MTELWGDVPYLDFVPQTPVEALLPRTSKAKIVEKMMNDLQNAADMLPTTWSGVDKGRITKGAALGLRARMALYNSQSRGLGDVYKRQHQRCRIRIESPNGIIQ